MTHTEKLGEIAKKRDIDIRNLFGKIELLKEILIFTDPKEANDFMLDTFMMCDNEIAHAFNELGLEE